MGIKNYSVYFYGIVYYSDTEDWPIETKKVLETDYGVRFSQWLNIHLNMHPSSFHGTCAAFNAEKERRCFQTFGVPGFEDGYIGHVSYPVHYIAPCNAQKITSLVDLVPSF